MVSSADIALLSRVSELAKRFGMKPSEAEGFLDFITDDEEISSHFRLMFPSGSVAKRDNFNRMMEALGCSSSGVLIADRIGELEDIVERAMSLAPRSRGM